MATGILQKGDLFADGQVVNASRLNNLVDLGDVLAGLISSKTDTPPVPGDFLLYLQTSSGNLVKAAFSEASIGMVSSVGLAMPASEFNVSGSPVTGSGTLTATWRNFGGNRYFASPASGATGLPQFRKFVPKDVAITPTTIAAANIDWSLSNGFYKTSAVPITFSFTNPTEGQIIRVLIVMTSGATAAWPSGGTGVFWRNNVIPVATPTGADIFTFYYFYGNYFGWADQNFGNPTLVPPTT
jgi:hypothetical protein